MGRKFGILMILAVGLSAVYGVYWFRTTRLTAASLAEFEQQQARIAAVKTESQPDSKEESEESEEQDSTDAKTAQLKKKANELLMEARANATDSVKPNDLATRYSEVPPEITIIPNESMPATTPEMFTVLFETTKGPFTVEIQRAWAPNGADRIYELVKEKFFTDMRVFRAVENFVVQFGIPGDPAVSAKWMDKNIIDDPVTQSNTEGMFTFAAASQPNSRSTQVFVNLRDNSKLDTMGFAPVGKVTFGLGVVKSLYNGYGDSISNLQSAIATEGNAFLDKSFPDLDTIKRAVFIEEIYDPNPELVRNRELLAERVSAFMGGSAPVVPAEKSPETYKVKFECSMGTFIVECTRAWSPYGSDRFYALVRRGFFDESKFFRVVPNFIVQFGLPADPAAHSEISEVRIPDDPAAEKNVEGTIVFAKSGQPDSRTTQIFVNLADNSPSLDPQGFSPFGKVVEGLDVLRKVNAEYGEQPEQNEVRMRGNKYLRDNFPRLDGITKATLVE